MVEGVHAAGADRDAVGHTRRTAAVYTFETKADPDSDGLYGSGDKCPTVPARGKSDANHNGCPGPFKLIGTKEAHFSGVVFPSFMRLNEVRVTGTPPGSRVVFSSPRGGDSATVNSSGIAKSRRVKGDFRYGSVITIRITKPQFVGVFLKEKVARGGLQVLPAPLHPRDRRLAGQVQRQAQGQLGRPDKSPRTAGAAPRRERPSDRSLLSA